jgi:succinate dehydrogenase / fumarate reductase, iron-sulfur subunit
VKLTLHVWRQKSPEDKGKFASYQIGKIADSMSFLEMLDLLNEQLIDKNEEPVAFDHDCREGICGSCSLTVNGVAHGPQSGTTVCQLHMRSFKDNDDIYIEPWRAKSFPVIKDLVTDRSAFDRITASGGFVSVSTGSPQDANSILVPKQDADIAMDAASCIGCGACVAACKNASATLFVAAKVSQFAHLPQGQVEKSGRAKNMLAQMEKEGFGHCTNTLECSAVCPKEIGPEHIAKLNREYIQSLFGF